MLKKGLDHWAACFNTTQEEVREPNDAKPSRPKVIYEVFVDEGRISQHISSKYGDNVVVKVFCTLAPSSIMSRRRGCLACRTSKTG